MDYDLERKHRESEDIRKACRDMFPLVDENLLPWAACQIAGFIRGRIRMEVEEATFHFVSQVSRVLCEVSPPKTHVVDMARIVVEKAKEAARQKEGIERCRMEIAEHVSDRAKLNKALFDIVEAAERWGREEDGIPRDAWKAYRGALLALGRKDPGEFEPPVEADK